MAWKIDAYVISPEKAVAIFMRVTVYPGETYSLCIDYACNIAHPPTYTNI